MNRLGAERQITVLTIAGTLVLLLGCTLWQVLYPESMRRWAYEDGPFENLTAVLYGLAAIAFAFNARRATFPEPKAQHLGRAFLIFWALGAFFIMGEEISWGQRIFGFDTPESIKELNYQEEFTIHNLQFIYDIFTSSKTGIFGQNAFFLFMFIVGVMFPLAAYVPWGRLLIQRIAFPVIPACYSLLFLGALFYGKYMQDFAGHPNTPAEVREFMWGLGIFLFAVHGLVRPYDLYRVRKSN